MELIQICNLPDSAMSSLRARAEQHRTSVEDEARAILIAGLAADAPTLVEQISMNDDTYFEFEPERLNLKLRDSEVPSRPADSV